jgi:small subunit ribosomal protein S20
MRTAIKRVRSITDREKAAAELQKTVKLLDQLAAKGIIHKNNAANNKSRLTQLVNKLK